MFLCTAERAAVTPLVQIGDSSYEATERTTACHVRIGRKCYPNLSDGLSLTRRHSHMNHPGGLIAVSVTFRRLGSVDGGTRCGTGSDRSAMINRQLISRKSSSRIHKGRLALFWSCTEAAAGAAGSSVGVPVGSALLLAFDIEEPRHICMSRAFLSRRARVLVSTFADSLQPATGAVVARGKTVKDKPVCESVILAKVVYL